MRVHVFLRIALVAAVMTAGLAAGQMMPNCVSAGGGVISLTCSASQTCCGDGTMSPQCLDKSDTGKCCRHFLSATRCNASQSCCGQLGVGASSIAFCCDAGSTCCKSSGTGDGTASCCPAGSQCCQAGNAGFCCGMNQKCNLITLGCDAMNPTPAPTMAPATTTVAPTTTSNANEVTTAAPVPPTVAPVPPTAAPVPPSAGSGSECGFVFVDAQFVLSGAGWNNVHANANAWNSLGGALVSDLASLLGRAQADIHIVSITAGANSLTVPFTVRSNALAEAARIAALIRDDVPPTAPLPATLGVYASVGQSSSDVRVASHTATSRDAFDCTTAAATSNANEVTTAAPHSSQPAEVTTAAPYSSQPAEVTTAAPYSSQPAEVTTQSPGVSSKPSSYIPASWGGYSPAVGQISWMPWLSATAAIAAVALMVR